MWNALDRRIQTEDFERDSKAMSEQIVQLTTEKTKWETSITTLTTEREGTSNRSDIIRLGVEIKMANSIITTLKENITQLNKDLSERNTEYKARLEAQAFEDQISALYDIGAVFNNAENEIYNNIDRLWTEYDQVDEFDYEKRD
jgi:hypothetical protein